MPTVEQSCRVRCVGGSNPSAFTKIITHLPAWAQTPAKTKAFGIYTKSKYNGRSPAVCILLSAKF